MSNQVSNQRLIKINNKTDQNSNENQSKIPNSISGKFNYNFQNNKILTYIATPKMKENTNRNIIIQKRNSVMGDLEKLKNRREERKRKFEDDKKSKIEGNNDPNKIDSDYEQMILKQKSHLGTKMIDAVI